jgi:hypothetical protein
LVGEGVILVGRPTRWRKKRQISTPVFALGHRFALKKKKKKKKSY